MSPSDLASAAGVHEGDLLAGKYRVDRVLGMGGMGVVVAAHHTQLDTKVALKFLLPSMLANSDAVARFAREARAAAKISNEHVARVLDVGTLENGAPYMVMEFLEGGDLSSWLQQRGRLATEQAVDFVLQASVAVAEAHSLGIVHRDLKPANLFCLVRSDGQLQIKVLDFGISKFNDVTSSGPGFDATRTNSVMGSPLYMSPQQLQSPKAVDARTDIWALGVILYELVVGTPPFLGETLPDVAVKIVTQKVPPLAAARPDAPPGLARVIERCLAKNRDDRYATVGYLAMDLLPFGARHARASVERIAGILEAAAMGSGARRSSPALGRETQAAPAGSWPAGTIAPVGHTKSARKARPVVTVIVVAGALTALAVTAGVFAVRRGGPATAAGASTGSPVDVAAVPTAPRSLVPVLATDAPPRQAAPPAPTTMDDPVLPDAGAAVAAASAKPPERARPAAELRQSSPAPPAAHPRPVTATPAPWTPPASPPNADIDPLARLKPKF